MNNTNPEHLETLDEPSLEHLIQYYLKLKHRMPHNLRVRDRLVELQQELLNRTTTTNEK